MMLRARRGDSSSPLLGVQPILAGTPMGYSPPMVGGRGPPVAPAVACTGMTRSPARETASKAPSQSFSAPAQCLLTSSWRKPGKGPSPSPYAGGGWGGCVCPGGRGLLRVLQGNMSLPPVEVGGVSLSSRVESGATMTKACTLLLLGGQPHDSCRT